MKALARAMSDRRETLPFRFAPGLRVPAGSLVVLVAAPGTGKSYLCLNWAWDLVQAGKPVLYHTPDTDLKTQAQRLMALSQDIPIDKVDPETAARVLSKMTFHMRWSEVPVNIETFPELVAAEVEYLGQAPALVIVDVVQDLIKEDSPEAYQSVFNMLHHTARRFKNVVLGVHHVNRGSSASGGTTMPRLADGRYGGEQRAYIELGLCQPAQGRIDLEVLKNRGGRRGDKFQLPFAPERGRIG